MPPNFESGSPLDPALNYARKNTWLLGIESGRCCEIKCVTGPRNPAEVGCASIGTSALNPCIAAARHYVFIGVAGNPLLYNALGLTLREFNLQFTTAYYATLRIFSLYHHRVPAAHPPANLIPALPSSPNLDDSMDTTDALGST